MAPLRAPCQSGRWPAKRLPGPAFNDVRPISKAMRTSTAFFAVDATVSVANDAKLFRLAVYVRSLSEVHKE